MKKLALIMICCISVLISGAAFSAQAKLTGQDYLNMPKKQRLATIRVNIENAKRNGVMIRNPAEFYCKKLDEYYEKKPALKKEGLGMVLKTLMIIEYDWDQKGVDKDKLAREWLGEDVYKRNKDRMRTE